MATDNTATLENITIPQEIQHFESEVPVETSPHTRNKIINKSQKIIYSLSRKHRAYAMATWWYRKSGVFDLYLAAWRRFAAWG